MGSFYDVLWSGWEREKGWRGKKKVSTIVGKYVVTLTEEFSKLQPR